VVVVVGAMGGDVVTGGRLGAVVGVVAFGVGEDIVGGWNVATGAAGGAGGVTNAPKYPKKAGAAVGAPRASVSPTKAARARRR
jgi:hypothetical protein